MIAHQPLVVSELNDSTVVLTTASQTQTVTFTASVSDNESSYHISHY